jgi:hypothetical protein
MRQKQKTRDSFRVGHVVLSLYRTSYEHIEVRVSYLDKLKALAFTLLFGRESSDPFEYTSQVLPGDWAEFVRAKLPWRSTDLR